MEKKKLISAVSILLVVCLIIAGYYIINNLHDYKLKAYTDCNPLIEKIDNGSFMITLKNLYYEPENTEIRFKVSESVVIISELEFEFPAVSLKEGSEGYDLADYSINSAGGYCYAANIEEYNNPDSYISFFDIDENDEISEDDYFILSPFENGTVVIDSFYFQMMCMNEHLSLNVQDQLVDENENAIVIKNIYYSPNQRDPSEFVNIFVEVEAINNITQCRVENIKISNGCYYSTSTPLELEGESGNISIYSNIHYFIHIENIEDTFTITLKDDCWNEIIVRYTIDLS